MMQQEWCDGDDLPRHVSNGRAQSTEGELARALNIGLIGAGAMGAALGALFVRNGCTVLTPLAGRSAASRERAAAAGMREANYADLAGADIVVSVVPPAEATSVTERVAGELLARPDTPLFVDANALAPESKRGLDAVISAAGGTFADGIIIGAPPRPGHEGPRFYVSGEHAGRATILRDAGLDVRELTGPVGTAAALKMCFGGFNKGITALTTAVMLAAQRSGIAEALIDEFSISQRFLLERGRSSVPDMYPKAYRWVAEFDEIARFAGEDAASARLFATIARFYEDRAAAHREGAELPDLLAMLLGDR
jgi:3-hydroxyisobutyrate dehydrogenase-like beta-hydroxyacid dehydrogenase